MCFRRFPLVDENRHKQRRHAEIDTRQIKGDDLPQHAAEGGGCRPVDVAQHREIKHRLAPFFRRKAFQCTVHGVGLVGERMDHIELASVHVFEIIKKCQRVKALAAVHEKRCRRDGQQRRAAR